MIRGAFFTLGLAAALGGSGWGLVSFLAYARSDAPMQDTGAVLALPGLTLGLGAVMMLGAWAL